MDLVNYFLFADDAKLCKHMQILSDRDELQKDFYMLTSRSKQWLLKLNFSKCSILYVSHRDPTLYEHGSKWSTTWYGSTRSSAKVITAQKIVQWFNQILIFGLVRFGTILQKPGVCCIVPIGVHTSFSQYPLGVWQLSSRSKSRYIWNL